MNGKRYDNWVPPPRPQWVERVNTEGSYLDIKSIVPLDEDSLIKTAVANTGLSEFGDDHWYEPFKILIKGVEEESELNLFGRIMSRTDLLLYLEARLRIEDCYKRNPEIDAEEITSPLFIIGQGRSGTSVLQNMMSMDPDNGTILSWEAMMPCPPPEKATYRTDPRIEKADKILTQMNRVTPEICAMHEFRAQLPTENIHLHCLGFRSPGWFNSFVGQSPTYLNYIAQQDNTLIYQYEKRVLKLLQWKNRRKHWVLKNPVSILHLPDLLKVYPDAKFIWTHRDPVKALSSEINLIGTLNWVRSDHPFIGESLAQFTDASLVAGMLSQPIDWLESGALPLDQLCNIHYQEFVKSPMAVVEKIYGQFGIEMTGAGRVAMQKYMDDNPRSSRPTHQYDVGSSQLVNKERELFKRYQDYFSVPSEV